MKTNKMLLCSTFLLSLCFPIATSAVSRSVQFTNEEQTISYSLLGSQIQSDGTVENPIYIDAPIERVGYAKTTSEAIKWVKSQIGKYIDYDHVYGAQCVDLIQSYAHFAIGKNLPSLNAAQYATVSLPSGWTRIKNSKAFVPKPGDIAIWTGNGYGHIGIITHATQNDCLTIEQNAFGFPPNENGKNTKGNQTREFTRKGYNVGTGLKFWGVLRPTTLK